MKSTYLVLLLAMVLISSGAAVDITADTATVEATSTNAGGDVATASATVGTAGSGNTNSLSISASADSNTNSASVSGTLDTVDSGSVTTSATTASGDTTSAGATQGAGTMTITYAGSNADSTAVSPAQSGEQVSLSNGGDATASADNGALDVHADATFTVTGPGSSTMISAATDDTAYAAQTSTAGDGANTATATADTSAATINHNENAAANAVVTTGSFTVQQAAYADRTMTSTNGPVAMAQQNTLSPIVGAGSATVSSFDSSRSSTATASVGVGAISTTQLAIAEYGGYSAPITTYAQQWTPVVAGVAPYTFTGSTSTTASASVDLAVGVGAITNNAAWTGVNWGDTTAVQNYQPVTGLSGSGSANAQQGGAPRTMSWSFNIGTASGTDTASSNPLTATTGPYAPITLQPLPLPWA